MLSIDDLLRIADALDVAIRLTAAWQGGELDRLINSRHSGLHESVARWMAKQPGWELAPEVSFSVFGERGVIDILAWQSATRTALVIELKTEIVDVNDLMGRVDVKRRLAGDIARERGWKAAATIAVWVIVADGTTNRRRVRAHSTALRTAFPHNMHLVSGWLASPTAPISALTFWSSAQQGDTSQPLATVKRVRRSMPRAA